MNGMVTLKYDCVNSWCEELVYMYTKKATTKLWKQS